MSKRSAGWIPCFVLIGGIAPLTAQAPVDPEAERIVQIALEKRLERWAAVDDYTLVQTMNGAPFTLYYEKITVDGQPAFRHVLPGEYEKREFDEAGLGSGLPGLGGDGAGGGLPSPGAPGRGAAPGQGATPAMPGQAGPPAPGGMPGVPGLPGAEGLGGPAGAGGMPGGLPAEMLGGLPIPEGLDIPGLSSLGKFADKLPSVPKLPSMPGVPGLPGSGGGGQGGGLLERAGGAVLGGAIGAATGGLQQRLMQKGMEGLMGTVAGKPDDGSDDARIEQMMFREMGRRARLAGTEVVDGVECLVLVAEDMEDLDLGAATGEDANFTLRTMTVWLDAEEYVSRRSIMEGDFDLDGQLQPVRIEILDQDYRRVETMYEPHRRVMRFGGMAEALQKTIDPKEMEKIEKELAEFEKVKEQLAQIPEAQRRMMEAQMAQRGGGSIEDQMERAAEQLRGFVSGDVSEMTEMVTEVEELRVNEGPPTQFGRGEVTVEGDVAMAIPRTTVSLATGQHPEDGSPLSMIQLMGGVEGESMAMLQLSIPGPYPEAGTTTSADAGVILLGPGEREVALASEEGGATITVTSRAGNRIRGEFSFEGTGEIPAEDGTATTIRATVTGTFDAPIPPATPQFPEMTP